VRRRKVGGARTRGPHAVIYGDFDGGPTGATAEGADKRTDVRADGRIVGRRCGCLEADGLHAEGRRPLLRGDWGGLFRSPECGRSGDEHRYAVPDHDAGLPDTLMLAGGPRG